MVCDTGSTDESRVSVSSGSVSRPSRARDPGPRSLSPGPNQWRPVRTKGVGAKGGEIPPLLRTDYTLELTFTGRETR